LNRAASKKKKKNAKTQGRVVNNNLCLEQHKSLESSVR